MKSHSRQTSMTAYIATGRIAPVAINAAPLLLLLAACSASPDSTPNDEAAETADASLSNEAEAFSYPIEYAALRDGARSFAAEVAGAETNDTYETADGGYSNYFDTLSCDEPDAEPATLPARDIQLESLAHDAMVLEARLKARGYLPEVWQEPVHRWQISALEIIDANEVPEYGAPGYDAFETNLITLQDELTSQLESNRARLQPSSLPIKREGGCGAAESPVFVTAEPPDGRIWIITRFAFDVCKARKLDAWDLNACRWAEVEPQREAWLSGTYMVQGKWPDGSSVRTNRRIEAEDPDNPTTITIRAG